MTLETLDASNCFSRIIVTPPLVFLEEGKCLTCDAVHSTVFGHAMSTCEEDRAF